MESIGHYDLGRRIFSLEYRLLRAVIEEAQAFANTLRPNSPQPTCHSYILLTANLVNKPFNLGLFHHNQDMAARGVAHLLHKICNVIFTDNVTKLLNSRSFAVDAEFDGEAEGASCGEEVGGGKVHVLNLLKRVPIDEGGSCDVFMEVGFYGV